MIEEIHVYVSGRVQGVGFRALVKRRALARQIHGYVRNLPDGRVEIRAQGKELKVFLSELQKDLPPGRIDHLEVEKIQSQEPFSTFEIL